MSAPAYIVTNDIDTTGILSSSSEDSVFVKGNIFDLILANPFRWSEDVSGGATIWLENDFGAAHAADTLAILGHNFPSGTTFSLKTGDSTPPTVELVVPVWREFDIYALFTNPNHRYWRLEVTITSADLADLGELYIGTRIELTSRMSFGFSRGVEHKKVLQQTQRGVRWNFDLFDRRFFDALFRSIQDNHIAELDLLDRAVNGERTPFVWIPDTALADVFFMRKIADHREENVRFNEWDVDLRLEEESRGSQVSL
jgi:hypothetical protein